MKKIFIPVEFGLVRFKFKLEKGQRSPILKDFIKKFEKNKKYKPVTDEALLDRLLANPLLLPPRLRHASIYIFLLNPSQKGRMPALNYGGGRWYRTTLLTGDNYSNIDYVLVSLK